jgi:hypothetical protein
MQLNDEADGMARDDSWSAVAGKPEAPEVYIPLFAEPGPDTTYHKSLLPDQIGVLLENRTPPPLPSKRNGVPPQDVLGEEKLICPP